jgi:glutaconate CoA-transferase subunit A
MNNKLSSLKDAINNLVSDGDRIVVGAGLEHNVPFAAAYEIIRQGKQDLDIIAPISDAATDMMIGAGCVGTVTGAWVGNVSGGLGHNHRRAVEKGEPRNIDLNDHSNFSLGMALMAAAYGMPYVPIRSLLGSDIVNSNPRLQRAENPFQEGEPVILVPPEKPDVAILPVQRADGHGNAHHWGSTGLMQESALAADRVIVLADEIVPTDVILSDPSRILFPAFRVSAVCETPAGGHPSPMIGRWRRDNDFFAEYHRRSRDRDNFLQWLDEWILAVEDHAAYRTKLGDRLEALRIKGSALSAPANYAPN